VNYFGFSLDNLFGKIFNDAFNSAILLHPDDERTMVIFSLYDGENNMVIYYDNIDDWGYQILPKEEVKNLYLDFRKNQYIPFKK